jgi:hypothetical protein
LKSYDFRQWKPGEELFVGADGANLRSKPDIQGQVLASLPLGTRILIKKVASKRVKVADRVDRWYRVEVLSADAKGKSGHLFGNVLTPLLYRGDLDGDGEEEIASVLFTADFKIRVRIREPGILQGRSVTWADAQPAGGAFLGLRGSLVRGGLVPASQAGVGLIRVESGQEACATFAHFWIGYQVPGGKARTLGQARVALELNGIADPPIHSSFEVAFKPDKTAKVVTTTIGEDEQGKESRDVTRSTYRLVSGIYQEVK